MKNVKKVFGAMLIATGIATALSGCGKIVDRVKGNNGYRDDRDISGSCGDNLTYEYTAKTGHLVIRGTGEMTSCPWSGYGGVTVKSVEFEEGLTNIYNGAFYAQSELKGDIILPSTVNYIDEFAFYGTSGLKSVAIPDGVTYLGDYAFRQSGIEGELVLPDSITYIGIECFDDCTNLTGNLKLPASLEKIGRVAFDSCEGFTGDLIIPDSVTEIGDYAFANCKGLNGKLVLSAKLEIIEANCFSCDEGLTGDLVIPDSVKVIKEYAFRSCGFDGELKLPAQMESIASGAFDYCSNLKGTVVVPEGITHIEGGVFSGCKSITAVDFPAELKYICNDAFSGCEALSGELVLPESLIGIGTSAFRRCAGFSGRLNIPESVEVIEENAFAGCSGFSGELILPSGIKNIGKRAFTDCSGISGKLVIPDSVVVIGYEAFDGCSNLKEVSLGRGVVSVGEGAFEECTALSKVTIENSDIIPDYYGEKDVEHDNSFPDECDIVVSPSAKSATDIWSVEQKKLEGKLESQNSVEAGGSYETEAYFWTDSLRQEEFCGVGEFADAVLVFDKSTVAFTVNGREYGEYFYSADANSTEPTVNTEKIWYREGYIENLEFYYGYGIDVLKSTYVKSNGESQELYFVAANYNCDPNINLKISIEEECISSPE